MGQAPLRVESFPGDTAPNRGRQDGPYSSSGKVCEKFSLIFAIIWNRRRLAFGGKRDELSWAFLACQKRNP
jgi:hypothetical protein